MTYKEALERTVNYIEHQTEDERFYSSKDENLDFAETIKKALEKQMPKKPYDVDTERKTFDCPECLSKLYADEDVRDCGYCCVCGQALDWEERKND